MCPPVDLDPTESPFYHAGLERRRGPGGPLTTLGLDVEWFPDYRNTRKHLHTCEMILLSYIVSGTGTHWLGHRKYDEGPGGLTVTHFGQRHDIVTDKMTVINIYIDPARLVLEPLGPDLDPVLSGWLPLEPALCRAEDDMVRLDLSSRPVAGELVMAMSRETSVREPGWQVALLSLLRSFLVECTREARASGIRRQGPFTAHLGGGGDGKVPRGGDAIARVRQHLESCYREPQTLDDLAALAGLDKSYLCRAFRKNTGRTVTEYVLERRLRAAVGLLRSGRHSVTEVAQAVGFNDPVYFTRVFTARIGVNPRRYGLR